MIEELKIGKSHQGFVFLYNSCAHEVRMQSPHMHKELELNIVTKGCAEYVLSNQRYQLAPGSIVWLFPGQPHLLSMPDQNFEMYVAVFKEELFQNTCGLQKKYNILLESNPSGSFCKRLSLPALQTLERICESICALNAKKEVMSPAYYYAGQAFGFKKNAEYLHNDPLLLNTGLSYLMTIGWHLFTTEGMEGDKEVLNPSVEKAVDLLNSFPEKDFSLSDLALECGNSCSRLSRLFNEQLGISIVDFKNRLKLEQFIECVKNNPDYSISEACYAVGFGSYSQFYKTFKHSFGLSPKAYFSKEL